MVRENDGPYKQPEIFTELAREAHWRGADWVLPIDADEFGMSLIGSQSSRHRSNAGALRVQIVNFIQRREQREIARRRGAHDEQLEHRSPWARPALPGSR